MAIKLIVAAPFGQYQKGDEVTDSKTVQAILDSENAGSVIKVPAPETAQKTSAKSS